VARVVAGSSRRRAAVTGRLRLTPTVRLDLRGVRRGSVRLRVRARLAGGRVIRQTRLFRTCAS
jgi:hypothetical protein